MSGESFECKFVEAFFAPLACQCQFAFVSINLHPFALIRCLVAVCLHLLALFVRSEKLQNESSPILSNVRPEFCSEVCSALPPNFLRSFRASFRGRRAPQKITKKTPSFKAKFTGNFEEKLHKSFLVCPFVLHLASSVMKRKGF